MSTAAPSKGSLFVIFLTVFIDLLGFGIVLPLLPIYAREFTQDETGLVLGLLMASFSAMQFLFSPLWGRLSDRIGRRPVLMIGLGGSVVFYALFGLASSWKSLTGLFVSRIGAGISGATISTAQAYIADTTTPEERTRGMALIGAAFGLGFTFGPLVAITALWSAGSDGLSPWPGYVAAGLSAVAFVFALRKLPESRQPGAQSTSHKLLDVAALLGAVRAPSLGALLAASFLSVLAFANFEAILSLLLKAETESGGFGFGIKQVLGIMALLGFVHALAQGGVRSMSKRSSEHSLLLSGGTILMLGYIGLLWATESGSRAALLTAIVVAGMAFAFLPANLNSLISQRAGEDRQGEVLGVGQSLSALARILAHGMCVSLFTYKASLPFWVSSGLMAIALVLIVSTARRPTTSTE